MDRKVQWIQQQVTPARQVHALFIAVLREGRTRNINEDIQGCCKLQALENHPIQ